MANIYVTGDTHRMQDIGKFNGFNKKCDYMVVAGDFGVPFQVGYSGNQKGLWSNKDLEVKKFYDNQPYKVLFVDGNHENFDYLDSLQDAEMFGGKVNILSPNIIHLKRGEIYNINGKTMWTFGGATSIDKHLRIEGFSWWQHEIATYEEMNYGLDSLLKVGNKVDYIITHTPPDSVIKEMFGRSIECPVAEYLDYVMSKVSYKKWYCGHMHVDSKMKGIKMNLLYDSIVRL